MHKTEVFAQMRHKNLVKLFKIQENAVLHFADGEKAECAYEV